ncbi:unnamed protein product [Adineta ricciae]|uniref:Uncharacterized protein n=1 Tax=Adineta ricciae TaxID=249248 RepID=A0A815LJD1_ADIRI|nr:unnamed protein product [Adineta ricciae]
MFTFIIILSICLLYISLKNKLINVQLSLTSLEQYEQVYIQYADTLSCPCNEISIKHGELVKLAPSYHEVCSLNSLSEEWIHYLADTDSTDLSGLDTAVPFQFQLLKSLCRLSREAVYSSLIQLHSTTRANNQLISRDSFQKRIDNMCCLNNLYNKLEPSFYYEKEWWPIFFTSEVYNTSSCTCAASLHCLKPATIDDIPIAGFFVGCYPIEAILHSASECVYNRTCIDLIQMNASETPIAIKMSLLQSKYKYDINETVQHKIDRLFIDEWRINHSYENYSDKCHSMECTS